MKKLIFLLFMLFCSLGASAQLSVGGQTDSARMAEMREKIGIDYSMPDFDTKKIDGKVIGARLAKILEFLQKNYTQGTYNRQLANIRFEATEDPKVRFLGVDKIKIDRITKTGNVVVIRVNTSSKNESKEKLMHEFDMVFERGVSKSEKVNSLFLDVSRYIKMD